MQQHIDISPRHNTLGSDTVSIHISIYRYIENHDVSILTFIFAQCFMIDAYLAGFES